jgi:hypothetical protein
MAMLVITMAMTKGKYPDTRVPQPSHARLKTQPFASVPPARCQVKKAGSWANEIWMELKDNFS